LTSSIYPQPATFSTSGPPIPIGVIILANDIPITSDLVSPGGGGILRLYFKFALGTSPAVITVTNNNVSKGTLNADNANNIITDGYYRFDIDVEAGDNINLVSPNSTVTAADSFFRAHLVQFGA